MIEKMYYDSFANEYVNEETVMHELTAPPERFLPTYRGDTNYIEHWMVDSNEGDRLDIAFMDYEYRVQCNKIRYAQAKNHHCKLVQLLSWTIPAHLFDTYVEMFGLEREKE